MNTLMLDGRSISQKIEDSIKILKENGYRVSGPFICKNDVKNSRQLVTFFYQTLDCYRRDLKLGYSGVAGRDLAIAKDLIEAREQTGISRELACTECCELIEALFRYEKYLGLAFQVTSMTVLGQNKFGWVTEKLLDICNRLNQDIYIDEESRALDELYSKQEIKISEPELLEAQKKMDRIIDGYEKEKRKK